VIAWFSSSMAGANSQSDNQLTRPHTYFDIQQLSADIHFPRYHSTVRRKPSSKSTFGL
jgi:hypothetical protein